jgi:esterase/lipase
MADISDSSLEFFAANGQKTAVTVVSHGLNNKPTVMLPLVKFLNGSGSDVYLLKLFGHREDSSNLKNLTGDVWLAESLNAYHQARELADKNNVPLYFLGYSLGALVAQYMIFESNGQERFDRQVLLAPATALRGRSGLLKTTFILPGHWKLPSYTPEAYRANEGIQLNVYKVLFGLEHQIQQGKFSNLNIPTLLIMDEKDELVSYRRLNKYIDEYGLTEYRILALDPSLENRATKYHHLIVDEPSMGAENWELSRREIKKFLFPDSN